MAKKRALPQDPEHNTPQKRTRASKNARKSEVQSSKDQKTETTTTATTARSASTTSTASTTSSDSTQTLTGESSPYTTKFFSDLAHTIASIFPFEDFARDHHCEVAHVSQAIIATITAPLSDPDFKWHEDQELTIPEYAEGMINLWKAHYEEKAAALRMAAKAAALSPCASPTESVSSSDESQNDADKPSSPRPAQESDEKVPSAMDSTKATEVLDGVKNDEQDMPKSCTPQSPKHAKASPTMNTGKATLAENHVGTQQDKQKSHSHHPDESLSEAIARIAKRIEEEIQKSEKSSPESTQASGTSTKKGSRGQGAPGERQQVYVDCYGNYVPVEEEEEQPSLPEILMGYLKKAGSNMKKK